MNTQDCFETLYGFRFEYIFRLNIQSVKECDPTKLSQEMGPHYVSCILSLRNDGGKIIPVLKHHTVEMCKESVDKVSHICMHITRCMWVMSSMYKSHGQISGSRNWRLNAKEVLVVQGKSLSPLWNQILFFLHINNYFGEYWGWWISVMNIKDKTHHMHSSN